MRNKEERKMRQVMRNDEEVMRKGESTRKDTN